MDKVFKTPSLLQAILQDREMSNIAGPGDVLRMTAVIVTRGWHNATNAQTGRPLVPQAGRRREGGNNLTGSIHRAQGSVSAKRGQNKVFTMVDGLGSGYTIANGWAAN
jgi:hypothetical protein